MIKDLQYTDKLAARSRRCLSPLTAGGHNTRYDIPIVERWGTPGGSRNVVRVMLERRQQGTMRFMT